MKITMKSLLTLTLLFLTTGILAQTQMPADTESSKVHWKGFKPTGEHYGTVLLKDGFFTEKDGKIVGGEFRIDMNTITDLDMPADSEYNAKLVNHLKSDDFFGAAKHPFATFRITSIEPEGDRKRVTGDLTIKENTHPVSFLATEEWQNGKVHLKSEVFKVDRSKFDVRFKSKSFFDDLADNFIEDDMEISVDVTAGK